MLVGEHLSLERDHHTILDDITLTLNDHEILGIIGPNGAGKSSLLSVFAGLVTPTKGDISLDNIALSKWSRRKLAKTIAFVEQQVEPHERIDVRHAIEIGRTPHKTLLSPWFPEDEEALQDALEKVNMKGFEKRLLNSLSGGEKQRIHIARALAQKPRILILDEPTNHLDIGCQLEILSLVRRLDLSVLIALHDLNHAAMFCDRIALLDHGRLISSGLPEDVLTKQTILTNFRANAEIDKLENGRLHIRYLLPPSLKG